MRSNSLYTKINMLPGNLQTEVSDFVDFLFEKNTISKKTKIRKAGFLKGKIEMSADFDEPIEDFKEYM